MSLEHELQKIYDCGIYVSICRRSEGGITVKLGGTINIVAEANLPFVHDIVPWLQSAISEHYPNSEYHLARIAPRNGSSNGKPKNRG
jgi:hypothetical protein